MYMNLWVHVIVCAWIHVSTLPSSSLSPLGCSSRTHPRRGRSQRQATVLGAGVGTVIIIPLRGRRGEPRTDENSDFVWVVTDTRKYRHREPRAGGQGGGLRSALHPLRLPRAAGGML